MKAAVGLLVASISLAATDAEDVYESRIDDNFVEKTTFRFRTKFNRAFVNTPITDFKTLVSRKVEVPPLLDGIMEDPCWGTADHSKSAFVQWLGREPNRKQTVVYVCHDDDNLYIATVCEEPVPKSLEMLSRHPAGQRRWATVGRGDNIEVFIELGGVGGTGQVFQFAYNIHPEVRYDGLVPYVPFIGTRYRLGGAVGAKRWICELAFPHQGFNTDQAHQIDFRYDGPPRRGEVWGLRVVRNGAKPQRGEERMRSTWTYNPVRAWHIPYPTGIIVFEDRNCLLNGRMNEVDAGTQRPRHWRTSRTGDRVQADLVFDDEAGHAVLSAEAGDADQGVLVTQKIGVLPNVGYRITARARKHEGDCKLTIGIDRPLTRHEVKTVGEWEKHEVDFFSEPRQREATVFISLLGSGSAAIDEIRVEQQIYGPPSGATCLTGNSPREDLNLKQKDLERVRYTYREPGTDKEEFPYRKQWTPGWIHGIPDQGGTTGWIPATKGSLTDPRGRNMIQWSHPRIDPGYVPYPKGHDMIFDLGREYYVRSVELLPSGPLLNMTVQVKPEGGRDFILTSKLRGAGVLNPPGPPLYGRLRKVNSVCRHVKVWIEDGKHGCYFVRIWGEKKGSHKGIKRFLWKEGLVVEEEKYQQFRKLEGPVLMPTPQRVEWQDGEFVLRDGVPVYYQDTGRARKVADCLAYEAEALFGIRLRLVPETGQESLEASKGAIVLGEPSAGGLAAKLAKQRGWQLTADHPGLQGYFLSVRPDGALLCGYEQAGTFYAAQTFDQLLTRRDFSTASARCVEIQDWPYIPRRMIDCRGNVTPGFIRALARMKVNVIQGRRLGDYETMCNDHFIEGFPAGWAGHSSGGPIETDDDENWYYLGTGSAAYRRINACPSHFARYEFYERAGRRASRGNRFSDININTDEMDGTDGGSRWNADRQCLRRTMSGDQLFTEMVLRAYDLFRLYNRKTSMLDTMLGPVWKNANGSYHDMYLAFDRIPRDIHLYCWRGIPGDPDSNPEQIIHQFERATMLQCSLPLQNRGRINEFYKAPPGQRVHGSWNTVWGACGPVDQVLCGQFCRSMTMVDGGCVIPYMTQAWNPDAPPIHTHEWALKIGHLQQRVGELALERELPSWRDDVEQEFFKIDLRGTANWSHIDPVPGDGKDWLDWGPNNDLRRMPRGDMQFEEVPFRVIEPASNGGKSIIVVKARMKEERLRLPQASPEIPIGRTAASLIFLRTNVHRGHAPGYRITYEGGNYLTVPLDAMGNESKKYSCYGCYPPGKGSKAPYDPHAFYRSARHRLVEQFSIFFRVAWLGTTGCGDPVKVTMHEWVNPYPERVIRSVSMRYPPGRQSDRVEVVFAITGVAPTPRDLALWKDRQKLPLVTPDETEIEPSDVPVIPHDGEWAEEEGTPKTYHDADGNPVCEVTGFYEREKGINSRNFFRRLDDAYLENGGTIRLTTPRSCRKVAVRGLFSWEYHGSKVTYGVSMFRRTDYTIEISPDGKTWTPVASKRGICGEDGAHVHALPNTPITYIRARLDARHYVTARVGIRSAGPGLTWLQLYR